MLQFKSTNFEDLIDEFNLNATDISIFITNRICEAIENNETQILIGNAPNILLKEGTVQFFIEEENYLDSLQINLFRIEEAEDYELCIKIKKYIDLLKANI